MRTKPLRDAKNSGIFLQTLSAQSYEPDSTIIRTATALVNSARRIFLEKSLYPEKGKQEKGVRFIFLRLRENYVLLAVHLVPSVAKNPCRIF